MSDQTINCIECKNDFVWKAEDQKWFREKGLLPPKRCRDCRAKKRAKYNAEQDAK